MQMVPSSRFEIRRSPFPRPGPRSRVGAFHRAVPGTACGRHPLSTLGSRANAESKAHSGSASSHPLNPRNSIGIGIESPRGSYTGGSLDAYFKGYREPKGRGRPPGNPVNVAMLIIPARMKSHLKTFLDASGINDRSVYPDMAGYANSFPPA
jgi:hypothetical protein